MIGPRARFWYGFFLLILQGACQGLSPRVVSEDMHVISIFNVADGGVEAKPDVLTLRLGEGVLFVNHTSFEFGLSLDYGNEQTESMGTIAPFSRRRITFHEARDLRYRLSFSSSRQFGTVSGRVMVEPTRPDDSPSRRQPPPRPPSKEVPSERPAPPHRPSPPRPLPLEPFVL